MMNLAFGIIFHIICYFRLKNTVTMFNIDKQRPQSTFKKKSNKTKCYKETQLNTYYKMFYPNFTQKSELKRNPSTNKIIP